MLLPSYFLSGYNYLHRSSNFLELHMPQGFCIRIVEGINLKINFVFIILWLF